MTNAPLISLEGISKSYGKALEKVAALSDVSLKINQGEMVAIVGQSGAGKSTLLNILGLLEPFDQGEMSIADRKIEKLSQSDLSKIRNENFGFVFQTFELLSGLTAIDNVILPLIYRGIAKKERQELAMKALSELGLSDRILHKPNELSGGQKQRVAIARAIITKPKIIFADEPTGSLDSQTANDIIELFKDLRKHLGIAIVIITHDNSVASNCDRIIRIADGKIVEEVGHK